MSSRPVRDPFSIKRKKKKGKAHLQSWCPPTPTPIHEGKKSMPAVYKSGVGVHSCNHRIEMIKTEDQEFEAILGYTTRPYLFVKKKNKNQGELVAPTALKRWTRHSCPSTELDLVVSPVS